MQKISVNGADTLVAWSLRVTRNCLAFFFQTIDERRRLQLLYPQELLRYHILWQQSKQILIQYLSRLVLRGSKEKRTYLECYVLYVFVLQNILLSCNSPCYAVTICPVLLCCTLLYCAVLYCTELYCTVLYCTVLYCTVLYCTELYCTLLYCTVLHWTVLHCTVLYCTVLY